MLGVQDLDCYYKTVFILYPYFLRFWLLNESLKSSNGGTFQFAYDEESNKYGYKVTDSEGADTFYPFIDTSDATATSADITEGFSAWVDGKLIIGSRPASPMWLTGIVTMPSKIDTNGGSYSGSISFETSFDTIPTVTYTKQVYYANYDGEMLVSISNITRTGFDFKITANINKGHTYLGQSSFTWTAQI